MERLQRHQQPDRPTAAPERWAGERGLTLIELLAVLVILGLIAAFAVPRLMTLVQGSKRDAAEIQIKRLGSIVEIYALDIGRYPTADQGLVALLERPNGEDGWGGPYLDNRDALTDPWGAPYVYRTGGERGYAIVSYGADGREGGVGDDADVALR